MSIYVDTSALVKRYVDEADSDAAETLLRADPVLTTARHTLVEMRRNLSRLLDGAALRAARAAFAADVALLAIIELDAETCERAAMIAESTGLRTLDALHLGAAQRVGGADVAILTYNVRQAHAARQLGMTVLGA